MAQLLSWQQIDALDENQSQQQAPAPPSSPRSMVGKILTPEEIDALPEAPAAEQPFEPRHVNTQVPQISDVTQGGPPVKVGGSSDMLEDYEGPVGQAAIRIARTAGRTMGVGGRFLAAAAEDASESPAQLSGYQEPFRNIKGYIHGAMPIEDIVGGIAPLPGATPFEQETAKESGPIRFMRTAATSLAEMEPRLAAGFAGGAAGLPASAAAALPMLVTDEGQFDPIGAAIAYGIPGASHAGEEAVARMLAKAPITRVVVNVLSEDPLKLKGKVVQELGGMELSNDAWRRFLESGGGFLAANAYLAAAEGTRNFEAIQNMTPEQKKNFILDTIASNLAPALLGFIKPGLSKTLEYKAPELAKQFAEMIREQQNAATEPQPSEPGRGLPGPTVGGEPAGPEVPPAAPQPKPAPRAPLTPAEIDQLPTEQKANATPTVGLETSLRGQPQGTPQVGKAVQGASAGDFLPSPAGQPAQAPAAGRPGQAPGAQPPQLPAPTPKPAVTPNDFVTMSPTDMVDWKKLTRYGPDDPERIAANWTVADLPKLLDERDKNRAIADRIIRQMDDAFKSKNEGQASKLMADFGRFQLKAQTLNELAMAVPAVNEAIQGMMPKEAEEAMDRLAGARAYGQPVGPKGEGGTRKISTREGTETKSAETVTKPAIDVTNPPEAVTKLPEVAATKPRGGPSIRALQPKPQGAKQWKPVGKNADGDQVFEDDRGVRSIIRNGVRVTEPVGLVPGRSGVGFYVGDHRGEFAVAPSVEKAVEKPATPAQPATGVKQPTEGAGGSGRTGGVGASALGPTGAGPQAGAVNPPTGGSVQSGVRPEDEGARPPRGGASEREPATDVDQLPTGDQPPAVKPESDPGSPAGVGPLPSQPTQPDPPTGNEVTIGGLGGTQGPKNIRLTDNPAPGGFVGRVEANIKAISLVRDLEKEKRFPADDERDVLAQWSGWGAFAEMFNEGRAEKRDWDQGWMRRYGKHYDRLQKLLTPEEFNAAVISSINANYTSGEVVSFMWKLARRLGFNGGQALDSATGSGVFVGMTPEEIVANTRWTGAEMDLMTGKIFSYLYPQVDFRLQPFEKTKLPNGFFDLNITNVPFGDVGPGFEHPDMNLHNYFIARGLDKVRPGGLCILITSANTMEARQSQRSELVKKGQLVGAIRLPNTAFKKSGGTEVVTDILVLRKPDGKPFAGAQKWEFPVTIEIGDKKQPVNEYFVNNPEMVLGTHSMTGTMYRKESYTVIPTPGELADKLNALLEKFPENIMQATAEEALPSVTTQLEDHMLVLNERGQVMESMNFQLGLPSAWDSSSKTFVNRAKLYIGVRDRLREQYRLERDPSATEEQVEANRKLLVQSYSRIGKELAGKDEITGFLNSPGGLRKVNFLSDDPFYATVLGIERSREIVDPNDDTKTLTLIEPADVLSKRVSHPDAPPEHVENATEALAVSMAYKGTLDMQFIEDLTGLTTQQVEAELVADDLAFKDPESGRVVSKNEYLSGDVRDKLAKAIFAAKESDLFARNVNSLRAVIPETIPFERINVTITARWTPVQVLNKFVEEVMGISGNPISMVPTVESFAVRQRATRFVSDVATTQWTTERMRADELLEHALNFRNPEIRDRVEKSPGNYSYVLNEAATALARAMVDKIKDAYQNYIRTTKDLVGYRYFDSDAGQYKTEPLPVWDVMEREFNRRSNSFVKPSFDGGVLKLPGLSDEVLRKQHLLDGVMRAMMAGSSVFGHGVGSGKTFLAIITAHELQRIGAAKKFMIWAKKSTMGQFRTSIERAYPGSKVLIPGKKDFEKGNRRKLAARIASGNWDFIVLSHEQAKAIRPGSAQVEQFFNEQIEALRAVLRDLGEPGAEDAKSTRGMDPAVRNVVKKLRSLQRRLDDHIQSIEKHQDTGLRWEDLGVDGLWVDESHNFKSIPIPTQLDSEIKGIPNSFSQRAVDMLIKARDVQRRTNGRNVFFASGTPISNTLAELWVQFYATNPQLLKDFQISTFDAFASTFADIATNLEFGWDESFKNVTRMSRFKNPVGLSMLTQLGMDVRIGNKELGLDVPDIAGGKPKISVVKATPAFDRWRDFLQNIVRAWNSAEPLERFLHSWVPIATMRAGLAAAVDPRCIFPDAEDHPGSKVNNAVRNILAEWEKGKEHRTTMMVFCDLYRTLNTERIRAFSGGESIPEEDAEHETPSTPTAEGANDAGDTGAADEDAFVSHAVGKFNVYEDIRRKLIASGVPENEIAIAYEHETDAQRDALFNKVRAGLVRILIGSTEKIGEGVDVPQRMSYQIHLDPPMQMTAAKLEQRIGRIIRQGNLHSPKNWNIPVNIELMATERSMDAPIYQLLFNKSVMTLQALQGKNLGESFEDPASDFTMALAQMVAAATGDDRAMKLAELKNEVRNLELAQSAYLERMSQLRRQIDLNLNQIENGTNAAARYRRLASAVTDAVANDETLKVLAVRAQKSVTGLDAINEWLKTVQRSLVTSVKDPDQTVEMSLIIGNNVRALLHMRHNQVITGHTEEEREITKGPRKGETETTRKPVYTSQFPLSVTYWLGGPDPRGGDPRWDSNLSSAETLVTTLKRIPSSAAERANNNDRDIDEARRLVTGFTQELNTTSFPQAEELKFKRSRMDQLERELRGDDPWQALERQAQATSPPLLYRMMGRLREFESSLQVDRDDQARAAMRSQLELRIEDQRAAEVKAAQLDAQASITEKQIDALKRRILYAEKVRYLTTMGAEPPELFYGQTPGPVKPFDIASPGETAPGAELQAQGIAALRTLFSREDTGLTGETRRAAIYMLEQPALQDLDWNKLQVSIVDRIDGGRSGQADLANWLVELARGARPQTFPHEVFHFLYGMMPPDVQAQVNQFRIEELAKADLPETVKQELQSPEGVSSDRWLAITRGQPAGIVQRLYYLSSPSEYLAGIGGEQFGRDSHANEGAFTTLWQKIMTWLRGLLDALRRAFGLRPSMQEIIRDLLAGKYRNAPATGRDSEGIIRGDITPPEDREPPEGSGVGPGDLEMQNEIGQALAEEGAETQVFGRIDKILGREGIGEAERSQGAAHAAAIFARAGLQIQQQENGLWEMVDPNFDSEVEGRRLLKLVQHEISTQNQRGKETTGYLGNLLNSIVENFTTDRVGAFSPQLRRDLYAVAQGERSHRGVMLAALQGFSNTVAYVARNVDVVLNRQYSEEFDGDFIRSIIDRVATNFRDYFTEKEIEDALHSSPALQAFIDKALALNRRDEGGRLYRKAQAALKPKGRKQLATLEQDARIQEAFREILEQLKPQGIEPKPSPNKPLSPLEQVLLMVHPKTADKINILIDKAISSAEHNAGIKFALSQETNEDDRQGLLDRFSAGEEPTPEAIEAGLDLPEFSHWKALRDMLTEYSPVTVRLVQELLRSDFRGTQFRPAKARPADSRLNLEALAKSPEAETERLLKAYTDNLEANIDLSHATDATKQKVMAMVEQQLTEQLEAARKRVREPMFQAPVEKSKPPTPEQRIGQLANAGLFGDLRLDIPAMVERVAAKSPLKRLAPKLTDLVRQALDVPFYRQAELKENFAKVLIEKLGIPAEQAANAAAVFEQTFSDKWKLAKASAAKKAAESLTPKERTEVTGPKKAIWQKILENVNAGNLDSGKVLQDIAREKGWNIPSESDVAKIRETAERMMRLRQLTRGELDAAGDKPADVAKAQRERDAVTLERRVALKKQIEVMWARMTKPMSFEGGPLKLSGWTKWWSTRRNWAQALNEFEVANLLFKVGFPVRLATHITTQLFWHVNTRAISEGIIRYQDDRAAGREARLWADIGKSLRDSYGDTLRALKPALEAARAALAGRAEARNVDRLMSGVQGLERMIAKSDELWKKGDYVRGGVLRLVSLIQLSLRVTQALDNFQGTPAELAEMRALAVTSLRQNGRSPAEAETLADGIVGNANDELPQAIAEAKRMLEASGETNLKEVQLREAGRALVMAKMYQRARELGLPADEFAERIKLLRRTISWQERTTTGLGGIVARTGKMATRYLESVGLPFSFARFANAMGTGINYYLMFTPLYATANANIGAGSGPSPWFRTRTDQTQRRVQAVLGSVFGSLFLMLAALGAIIVRRRLGKDKEEREMLIAQGHRDYTVEILTGPNEFMPFSMSVGWLSPFAPYLAAGGALFDLATGRAKAQAKLNDEAEKAGLEPGKIRPVSATDALGVAWAAAEETMMGGRTATGLSGALMNEGLPNSRKAVAAYVSAAVPLLPAYQEISRMMGVNLDSKLASVADFMVPLPTSQARAVNILGDPVKTPDDLQRITQTITAGTFGIGGPIPIPFGSVKSNDADAYATLMSSGYRPTSINPDKPYDINGVYRPMSNTELVQYTVERGQAFKSALIDLGPDADAGMVKSAFQQANDQALSSVGASTVARAATSTAPSSASLLPEPLLGQPKAVGATGGRMPSASSVKGPRAPAGAGRPRSFGALRKPRTGGIRATRGPSIRARATGIPRTTSRQMGIGAGHSIRRRSV